MLRAGTQSAARKHPWVQHPTLLSGLMLWNSLNLPQFTETHNQWCWWAGNDDLVNYRHRDWTTKTVNFAVRVFRVGKIQCKIKQGSSSRIPWTWKSGRYLMPVEKEKWRFPWIPTGSTQLQPLPANTDKVVLLSCKKWTAAGYRCLRVWIFFFPHHRARQSKKSKSGFPDCWTEGASCKYCRNRQIPLLIPEKLPPPAQNMESTREPQQRCPSSSARRGWRSHSQNQAGQVIPMKRTCRRNYCRYEIIPRGPSTVQSASLSSL